MIGDPSAPDRTSIGVTVKSLELPTYTVFESGVTAAWFGTVPATVIGGIGNPFGAVAGALIIGLVEETSALAISTTYRQGVSFAVLVLVLLLRPQGLLGVARIRR